LKFSFYNVKPWSSDCAKYPVVDDLQTRGKKQSIVVLFTFVG